MHELSYATSMLNTILETVKNQNFKNVKRVSKINLEIGELTFINVEQLKFAFEVISRSTVCEGAEIEVKFIKPYVVCGNCGYRGELDDVDDLIISCPKCNSVSLKIEGGREFNIKSITVEFEGE